MCEDFHKRTFSFLPHVLQPRTEFALYTRNHSLVVLSMDGPAPQVQVNGFQLSVYCYVMCDDALELAILQFY
jgi:hypothetical protein